MAEEKSSEDHSFSNEELPRELHKKLTTMVGQLEELRKYTRLSAKNMGKAVVLGACTAFGATVGFAILIALLSWFVTALGGLPLIGNWLIHLGHFIHQ